MQNSLYQQAIKYIYSFSDYETTHKLKDSVSYDLRRVEELMRLVGNPHLKTKSVHIAGTKGKGSVAAMISAALTAAGYKTGLYTSPHLIDIRERFQVDGNMITETEFADIIEELKPAVEEVNNRAAYGVLTTFEIMTALCFMFFARQKADFQVVEVGLGGRLDATNIIKTEVCVITPVNFDHTDVLGDTIAKIAAEKTGIIKERVPVVSSPQEDEAMDVIIKKCIECHSRLVKVGVDVIWYDLGLNPSLSQLEVRGRLDSYHISLPLLGCCQMENAATAIAALEVLNERGFTIPSSAIVKGLSQVNWPGRFQVMGDNPLIIIDGAHNTLSARELKKSLLYYYHSHFSKTSKISGGKNVLVFGASSDKDVKGMAERLSSLFDVVIVTRSKHPRSMEILQLAEEFKNNNIELMSADDVPKALGLAISQALNEGLICVTGSLFIAGDAIDYLSVD